MHTTAYFLSSLIGNDRPTDATTKAKFIMQISRGFPEKVNTIIAVLAELTRAIYNMVWYGYSYSYIHAFQYLIRLYKLIYRIFSLSVKFIENHLHVQYDTYTLSCCASIQIQMIDIEVFIQWIQCLISKFLLYKQCKLHHMTI